MPQVRRVVAALVVGLGMVVAAAPAHAGKVVGLLDVSGDVGDAVLERFADAVEDGLAGAHDLQPATRKRMQEMLDRSTWTRDCLVGPCLEEVRAQTGADEVVIAALSAVGQSYRYTITLLDTRTGNVLFQVSEGCIACTVEDVLSSATMATIGLLNNAGDTVTAVPITPVAAVERAAKLEERVRDHRRSLRRTALLVVGAGLLAAGTAAYFISEDRDDVGYPVLGAAGGLAASGAVMLGLSLHF